MVLRKILLIIPQVSAGGAERVSILLGNQWAGEGLTVTFHAFVGSKNEAFFEVSESIIWASEGRTQYWWMKYGKLKFLREVLFLRKVLRDTKPDVAISFLPAANIATLIAAVGTGVRTVISERNDLRLRKVSVVLSIARFLTYRLSDVVVINRRSNRDILKKMVNVRKIKFLRNPIAIVAHNEHNFRTKTILSVGRLVDQKRFDLLIKAFWQSGMDREGWRLVIVGDGPLQSSLASLGNALGIGENLELNSATTKIWETYSNASIFALFSEYEGMPNVLLEALMHGLFPLVTLGVGDLAEEIREFNEDFVITNPDLSNCTESLKKLIENWSHRDYERSAITELVYPYSLEKVSKEWLWGIM